MKKYVDLIFSSITATNEGLCPGISVQRENPLDGDPPLEGYPQDRDLPFVLTSSGGHQSGQYSSYWNAFLIYSKLRNNITVVVLFFPSYEQNITIFHGASPTLLHRFYLFCHAQNFSFAIFENRHVFLH